MFAYRSLAEVGRWLTALPTDREEYVQAFAQRLDSTLVIEREHVVVGDLMVTVQNAWSQAEVAGEAIGTQAELGWCIAPEHKGQGYATEAVRELIVIAFDLGVRRIEAVCFADNRASWRVMDKVGLRREGYFVQESLHRDGTWHDGISYALLLREWREGLAR